MTPPPDSLNMKDGRTLCYTIRFVWFTLCTVICVAVFWEYDALWP